MKPIFILKMHHVIFIHQQEHTIHDKVQELKNARDAQPHCLAWDCLKSFHVHCIVKNQAYNSHQDTQIYIKI